MLSEAVGNSRAMQVGIASEVGIVSALHSSEAIQHRHWVGALRCFAVEAERIDSVRAAELDC